MIYAAVYPSFPNLSAPCHEKILAFVERLFCATIMDYTIMNFTGNFRESLEQKKNYLCL